jgi:hypothetical protein
MKIMRLMPILALISVALGLATIASANGLPSGERTLGKSTLEPAYNDTNGSIIYLLTPPNGTTVHSNPKAWSPLFVVVYPTSAAGSVGTLNCMHVPTENCPSHGDGIAAAAASIMPSVYSGGVVGHDHLVDGPGGKEFNIAWEPVLVLFTKSAAANEHITTDAQIDAAVDRGDAIKVPLPTATFNCAVAPAVTYDHAVPVS